MMISALKMTADRLTDSGVARRLMFRASSGGTTRMNTAGTSAPIVVG